MKDYDELKQKFQETFGFKIPLDGFMTALSGQPTIDIIKLDERIDKEHPDYDHENRMYKGNKCSMAEAISLIYSDEANRIIDQFM